TLRQMLHIDVDQDVRAPEGGMSSKLCTYERQRCAVQTVAAGLAQVPSQGATDEPQPVGDELPKSRVVGYPRQDGHRPPLPSLELLLECGKHGARALDGSADDGWIRALRHHCLHALEPKIEVSNVVLQIVSLRALPVPKQTERDLDIVSVIHLN